MRTIDSLGQWQLPFQIEEMSEQVPHREVNEIRDALVHYLKSVPGLGSAEAFLIVQAIERFIVAKMNDR